MLNHPTLDKLNRLKCPGMATALTEQFNTPDFEAFAFEERLGLLVDRELTQLAQNRDSRLDRSRR